MKRCYGMLTLSLAIGLCGCLGALKVTPTPFYTLEPSLDIAPATPSAATLGVRPFFAARPYKAKMVYRNPDGQLVFKEESWAELPAETLTRSVRDAIIETRRFADVGDAADLARPDYQLTGELRTFYAKRISTEQCAAELSLRLELRKARDVKALWAETLCVSLPMSEESPVAFANAMEEAIATVAQKAATAISGVNLP